MSQAGGNLDDEIHSQHPTWGSVLCVGLNQRSAPATHVHLDRSAVPVYRIDEIRAEFSALHKNRDDQAASRERFERAIRDKADLEMDYRIVHLEKGIRDIHAVGRAVLDGSPKCRRSTRDCASND